MNHTTRFDGKGELYAKARPTYAKELLAYLKNTRRIAEGTVFADIGSGTGIWTEQLLHCGYTVYAVEPNADMRRKAEEGLSGYAGFHSVNGTDSHTALSEHSVAYVTAAQAFHWFDAQAFREECRRILIPDGEVLLIYNSRDERAACTRALAELRKEYSPEFHGFGNGISDEACRAFFPEGCEVLRWDNSQTYDRTGYLNRLLSSSYSPKEENPRFGAYIEACHRLFDRFATDGVITVPTHTVVYIGRVGS